MNALPEETLAKGEKAPFSSSDVQLLLSGFRVRFSLLFLLCLLFLLITMTGSLARAGPETEGDLKTELIDYQWTITNSTGKNATEITLKGNISVEGNATLYLVGSRVLVGDLNDSCYMVSIRDNATLVLLNSEIRALDGSAGGVRLKVLVEGGNLQLENSTLNNTTIRANNGNASFLNVTAYHKGFNFSSWEGSSVWLEGCEFGENHGVSGNWHLLDREANSAGELGGHGDLSLLLLKNASLISRSSHYQGAAGDVTILALEYQLIRVSLYDGQENQTNGVRAPGQLELFLGGKLETILNLSGDSGDLNLLPILTLSIHDGESEEPGNVTISAILLDNVHQERELGRETQNFISALEFRGLEEMIFSFAPDLVLAEPIFHLNGNMVTSIEPGTRLAINVTVSNQGNRRGAFDVYFYILSNAYDIVFTFEDMELGANESLEITGYWDTTDYAPQKWNLKITVDRIRPYESNTANSEVSKSISLSSKDSSELPIFLLLGLPALIFVGLVGYYIFFLKRAELFGDYQVEDVLLLDNGGRLMTHFANKEYGLDRDIVGSMLHAIQDFVNVSFLEKDKERLKSLGHGGKRILIEYGNFASLAVVIEGMESGELREEMERMVYKIHTLYGKNIPQWDGDISRFPEAEVMLRDLALKHFGFIHESTKFFRFIRDELFRRGKSRGPRKP